MDQNKLQKFYFPGKEPDEQIIMALRCHKIVIGQKIFGLVIGCLIPVAIYWAGTRYTNWLDDRSGILYTTVILVFSLFELFLLLFVYHAWVNYYLDLWIITNERIIAMEQRGLFNRSVSELRLNRIQDVSSEVKGFLPTLFKYGRIHIQTAAEQDMFEFKDIPNPEIVARQILELHERYVGINQGQPGQPSSQPPAQTSPPAGNYSPTPNGNGAV